MSGATVIASGVTGSDGCVILDIGSPGTYTATAAVDGVVVYSFTGSMGCTGGITLTSLDLVAGFGCCSGYPLPIPTTLYATVCGQIFTMNAFFIGGFIVSWDTGSPSINTSGVAVLTSCSPFCIWDGSTTTTGAAIIGLSLACTPGISPVFGATTYLIGNFALDTIALAPASCFADFSTCGTALNAVYQSNQAYVTGVGVGCSGVTTSTSGTWGPVVSLTSTVGPYVNDVFGFCHAGVGCFSGAGVTITS